MGKEVEDNVAAGHAVGSPCDLSAEQWLSEAGRLVPMALEKAKAARGFACRWKAIRSKLERVPPCLSDLSSHPCFSKNALCCEQLLSVCHTLAGVVEVAGRCSAGGVGKLQMQSDIDSLSGKLDLCLKDCGLLIKTGVLGEVALPPPPSSPRSAAPESHVRELFARLQIGHSEAKHRAVDGLLEAVKENEKSVRSVLGRSNVSALVQLLTAASTSSKVREKAATILCMLVESGGACDGLLISEGALPPLIRLVDSGGGLVGRQKAVLTLHRLSMSSEAARSIVAHGGVRPLIEACRGAVEDSVSQAAAAGTLKNISAVPDVRQSLADEGGIGLMVELLDRGTVPTSSKEYAAECLQHLTAGNESLRRAVASGGGIKSLLAYLDGRPAPPESAVGALRNLVGSVSPSGLVSVGLLPRLVHVLEAGSSNAQQAAASAICKISTSAEMKRLVGECGCIPLLVSLLQSKSNGAREAAAQAVAGLMAHPQNARAVKKEERAVPNLVQLLDPSPHNAAKKYAVSCLVLLSTSKSCKKLMVSHGAIGYLKKLAEMDVPGSKKLLERLERGKLRSLFSRK